VARRKLYGVKKKTILSADANKYLASVTSYRKAEVLTLPIANTGKDSRPTGR